MGRSPSNAVSAVERWMVENYLDDTWSRTRLLDMAMDAVCLARCSLYGRHALRRSIEASQLTRLVGGCVYVSFASLCWCRSHQGHVPVSFVLNSTLAFLLVFRLNRAAERYWDARRFWGDIVAISRTIVSGILVHAPNGKDRDEVLRWLGVFAISTMELLRGHGGGGRTGGADYPIECFAGFLTPPQVRSLQQKSHPPIFAANRVRHHLKRLFPVRSDEAVSVALANATRMDRFEEQLNSLIRFCGGMERIKATPLPIVYVSHLRTFLLINLMLFPWVFGPSWGWSTIPIVAVSAFAWIGIDAAAVEVESPFQQVRVNALNMNAYVMSLLNLMQDQMMQAADHEVEL